MEKNFIRVRSIKDITISSVLTITGCVLIALPTATSINVLGFFMIFTGILLFFLLKTGYKDQESGVKYCKKERFFAQAQRAAILDKLACNPDGINLKEEDQGNAVRLDIFYSEADGKAYLQLFEYIPYKYEPCSKLYEHSLCNITNLK